MEARSISRHQQTRTRPESGSGGLDELRAGLHGMWSGVAGAWGANADFVDARGAAVTERMIELTAPRPGERVLELACGTGGPGLEVASLVGPGGEVIQSDVAAEMTEIAAARAEALGLGNVRSRVLDLESIDEADGSFDVVICREGLMLVPDPARAAGEIRRVLRPDGRVVLSVWGPRTLNPWLGVVFGAVSAQLGTTMPPAGIPQPFSLDDADRLAGLLSEGGLSDVVVEEIPTPYCADSVDEWWERTAALAGPLAQRLAMLPEEAARELRSRAGKAIAAYETPAGLEIPGVSLLASAGTAERTGGGI
jgi:SAM-dependent methyltransferase